MIPKTFDKLSASPMGDRDEFNWAFAEIKAKHPGRKLEYLGYADGTHWFREWGNNTPFTVKARPTFVPKFS